MLASMAPDTPGAPPREPGGGDGDPTTASFRGGVEQVDANSAPAPGPALGPRRARAAEAPPSRTAGRRSKGKVRARKVHRIVRHVEPWSVLKVSLLFFLALFLIICVASAVLWSGARSSGSVENVEDFITEVGGFGNCPPVSSTSTTTTTIDPATSSTTVTTAPTATTLPGDALEEEEDGCPGGAELEGAFKFEDERIFEAFGLGGAVLVLAGSAGAVVMALLFNLISDLTGGVRVTVLEEEPPARAAASGSPGRRRRD
jgi:hypothetical protein